MIRGSGDPGRSLLRLARISVWFGAIARLFPQVLAVFVYFNLDDLFI